MTKLKKNSGGVTDPITVFRRMLEKQKKTVLYNNDKDNCCYIKLIYGKQATTFGLLFTHIYCFDLHSCGVTPNSCLNTRAK